MKIIEHNLPKFLGRNLKSTPKEVVVDQMAEPRPLPLGRKEFEEWSDRIIAGAMLPKDPNADETVFRESLKFALAAKILHVGATESHKPDAYFIHGLRVDAAKQVAQTIGEELRTRNKERLAKKEEAKAKEPPKLEVVS